MSAKYKSPSFLLPNELNTDTNTSLSEDRASMYSMDFDGTQAVSQGVGNFTSFNGVSECSVSIWFKSSTSGQGPYKWFFNVPATTTGNHGFGIYPRGTFLKFHSYTSTSSPNLTEVEIDFGGSQWDGNWHHLVLTYKNGVGLRGYYDSVLQFTNTSATGTITAGGEELAIGNFSQTGSSGIISKIDEVTAFTYALTDGGVSVGSSAASGSNVYNLYNSGSPASTVTVLNLNPVVYYPLGEQAQNTGYLGNEITNGWQFPNGVLQDYVIDFDGSNQYINAGVISALSNVSEYSISLWANIDTGASGTLRFFGNRESSSPYNGIGLDIDLSSSLYFYLNGGPSYPVVQVSNISNYVTAGTWFNLVCTFNTGQAYVFIDGVQRGSATGSSTADTTTNPLYIGADPINTGSYFDGQISNFVLWSSDQSANIANIYNNGSPQTTYTVTPQNWWKLNADSVYTPSAPNYTTALNFDGNNDLVNANSVISSISSSTTGTVSGWIKYTTGGSAAYMITFTSNTNTSQQYLTFQGNSNGVAFAQLKDRWILQTNNTAFASGNWYHFTVTQNGTEPKIYINGTEYSNGNGATLTTYGGTDGTEWWPDLSNFNTVTIGGMIWNSGGTVYTNYGNQDLSNISIFNSALTATQISTLFNFGTPETNISFSPTAWWKLNDQTAITDSSGNGNTGTNNGATDVSSGVAFTPSWKIPDASGTSNGVSTTLPSTALQQSDLQFDSPYSNYSLSFDGTGDYIDCGTSLGNTFGSSVSNMTISLWYKNETGSNEGLFTIMSSITAQTTAPFAISYNTNSIYVWFGSTDYNYYSQTLDSNWHHLSIVKNGTSLTTYIDGSSVSPSGTSGSIPATIDTTNKKTFIGIYYSASFGYNGKIDETAIFNTALTSAQVLEIYNNGRPKDLTTFSGTAPISWWRLGENAYFNNNSFTVPNSITGAGDGIGSGSITTMISADAPGTYANGIGTNLDIIDRVGDAPLSVANSQSYNMIPDDKVPYVPGYVGLQTTNVFEMTFDGTNYFNAGNASSLNWGTGDGSVSCWFKTSYNAPGVQDLVINGSYASGGKGYILYLDSSERVGFYLDDNSSPSGVLSTSSVNDGDWHHVVGVRDSGTMKLYLDGSEITTGTDNTGNIDISDPLIIGAGQAFGGSVGNFFNGQIDEVAIFDKALTADQIKFDLYSATTAGKTADIENNTNLPTPLAWYRMGD